MQANLVRLERVPRQIGSLRSLLPRPDAVFPAVAGHEVATRIADGGYPQLAYQIHHVGPETVGVGGGMPRLIDPVVDATPQVLDEGTKQATVHRAHGGGRIEDDPCFRHEAKLSASPRRGRFR